MVRRNSYHRAAGGGWHRFFEPVRRSRERLRRRESICSGLLSLRDPGSENRGYP